MKEALNLGMEFDMKTPANRMSILLLEESAQTAFLAEFFITSGFRILTARSSQEALAYYQTGTPDIDVLISDITFPGLSQGSNLDGAHPSRSFPGLGKGSLRSPSPSRCSLNMNLC